MAVAGVIWQGKKGIVFSLVAISLLALAMFSYSTLQKYRLTDQFSVTEVRVGSMDKFLSDIEKNVDRAIYVSGFRSLIAMGEFIATNATFITNLNTTLRELMTNGSIYGQPSFFMENNTFNQWAVKMDTIGSVIGIDLAFSLDSVSIYHDSPWTVVVEADVTVSMDDSKGMASWTRTINVKPVIEIDGFEDPMYSYYTGLGVFNTINRTIYDGNYVSGNNTANLQKHANYSWYTAWQGAPSFLMRLQNKTNASEFGIESLVNKEEVAPYFACPAGTSSVDSVYWRCNNTITTWGVQGLPASFKLDNLTDGSTGRINKYQVSGVKI